MWGRFDDQITHHPKMMKVGVRAAYFHFAAIIWCARYRTDGYIPKEALPILAPMRDYKRLARMLVEVRVPTSPNGLWEEVEGGYRVHDFLVCHPSAAAMAQREEADRKRLRAARSTARDGQAEPSVDEPGSGTVGAQDAEHEQAAPGLVDNEDIREPAPSAASAPTGRRRDVGPTSSRRRPVRSQIQIQIRDRSQDHPPVCDLDPRAPAPESTHTDGRDDEPVQSGEAPIPVALPASSAAAEIQAHLRAMPPPLSHLATAEHATRFAGAQLAGLALDDIRRAITAAGLKLGKHAAARPEEPRTLAALADHVGSFLANQTPAPVSNVPRAEVAPEAVDGFIQRWSVIYARAEGIEYATTDEDRQHAAEVVGIVQQVAREHSLPEDRLAEHWIRAYLRDGGANEYLAKSRHPLRYLKRGLGTYGLPRTPRAAKPASADVPDAPAVAMSGAELASRGREFLRALEGGPGVVKASSRSIDSAIAAGGE